ncbi:hypothetical protein ID866_11468, partial [Astraeus odoratus]
MPAKRAQTRLCPACSEQIPVRLLEAHAVLELQRVDDIVRHIGDAEPLPEADDLEEGPSNRARRSALKARQSLTALQAVSRLTSSGPQNITTPVAVERAIAHITRRRKARQTRLRELAREDASYLEGATDGDGVTCPVCEQHIRGDKDVIEAHVDACLAYETRRAEIEREGQVLRGTRASEDAEVDVDVDGAEGEEWESSVRTRVITAASLRGTGIDVRTHTQDTEDDIDIDGTDDAMFGDAQFAEADVLGLSNGDNDNFREADTVAKIGSKRSDHSQQTREGPVDEGSALGHWTQSQTDSPGDTPASERSVMDTDEVDLAILAARARGDHLALIAALERKIESIPSAPTCR